MTDLRAEVWSKILAVPAPITLHFSTAGQWWLLEITFSRNTKSTGVGDDRLEMDIESDQEFLNETSSKEDYQKEFVQPLFDEFQDDQDS